MFQVSSFEFRVSSFGFLVQLCIANPKPETRNSKLISQSHFIEPAQLFNFSHRNQDVACCNHSVTGRIENALAVCMPDVDDEEVQFGANRRFSQDLLDQS